MNWISDSTAKRVLANVVRDAVKEIPTIATIQFNMFKVTKTCRNLDDLIIKTKKFFKSNSIFFAYKTYNRETRMMFVIPRFHEVGSSWELRCEIGMLRLTKNEFDIMATDDRLIFSGHALERLFQRSNVLSWEQVKYNVTLAVEHYLVLGYSDYISKYKQLILPTKDGAFIGVVTSNDDNGKVSIKTFYTDKPNDTKNRIWQAKQAVIGVVCHILKMTEDKKQYDWLFSSSFQQYVYPEVEKFLMVETPWLFKDYVRERS